MVLRCMAGCAEAMCAARCVDGVTLVSLYYTLFSPAAASVHYATA